MTTSTPTPAIRAATPGPGGRPGRPTRRGARAPVAVAIAVVAALVAWLRLPPAARDTLWAEDGRVFVQQRAAVGPFESWFVPYDGYLHVVPRIVADLAWSWLPVGSLASGVTVLSCLVAGVVAAGVWCCSRGLVASPVVRLALAAVTVLVPLAPLEVSGNLANLHWYLLWLTPFLLLHRHRSATSTVLASVAALLIGLTEIQAVLLVPLVVLAGLVRRRTAPSRRDLVPVAVLCAALVAQLVVAALTPRADAPGAASTVPQVVLGYLTSVVLGTWVPSASVMGDLLDRAGWPAVVVAAVPFVVSALVVVRSSRRSTVRGPDDDASGRVASGRMVLASVVAVASIGLWTLDVVVNHGPDTKFWFADPGRVAELGLTRYGVVPSMFLVVVVLCAVDALLLSTRRRLRAAGAAALVVLAVVAATWFVGPDTVRADGPRWERSLGTAGDVCDGGAEVADVAGAPAGWGALLPCDVVDDVP